MLENFLNHLTTGDLLGLYLALAFLLISAAAIYTGWRREKKYHEDVIRDYPLISIDKH